MGPRLPPRLPAHRATCAAASACRSPPSPPPRTRKRGRNRHPPLRRGAARNLPPRFRPAEHPPRLRRQGQPARPDPALRRRAQGAVGHRLLRHPRQDRNPCPGDARGGAQRLAYHAGLDPDERRHVETRFQRDDGLIVVATVALRHGDRQARHPLGRPCRPAQVDRGLLSGNRPRRPRWRAGRDAHPLRRRRHPLPPHPDRRGACPPRPQAGRPRPPQRPSRPGRGDRLPAADPPALLRRGCLPLRQLRSLRPPGRNLRRHRTRAHGPVGHPAHRRKLRRGPPDRHPDRHRNRQGPRTPA